MWRAQFAIQSKTIELSLISALILSHFVILIIYDLNRYDHQDNQY